MFSEDECPTEMKDDQRRALKRLERAFLACKKARLCFEVRDTSLLAFDADWYNENAPAGVLDTDKDLLAPDRLKLHDVEHHMTIVDCGAQ